MSRATRERKREELIGTQVDLVYPLDDDEGGACNIEAVKIVDFELAPSQHMLFASEAWFFAEYVDASAARHYYASRSYE